MDPLNKWPGCHGRIFSKLKGMEGLDFETSCFQSLLVSKTMLADPYSPRHFDEASFKPDIFVQFIFGGPVRTPSIGDMA